MLRQRRRLLTPIAVLTGLFGLGAASAHAAGRVSADDRADTAVVTNSAQVSRPADMKLVGTFDGDAAEWHSTRLVLTKADYQAVVTYKCQDSGFLYVSWNGEPNSYEESHASAARGTVVLNGKEGGRGYFTIDTWLGCSWAMNLYS